MTTHFSGPRLFLFSIIHFGTGGNTEFTVTPIPVTWPKAKLLRHGIHLVIHAKKKKYKHRALHCTKENIVLYS
jgi:hypothetical protein